MSQQINLFNPIFLAQKKYFSAAAMLQALGLVLGGMLVISAFAVHQARTLEGLVADAVRDATQQREQLVILTKQFSDQGVTKKLEEDIARVEEQLRKRNELFAQLNTSIGGNAEGFSVYLKALARQTTPGVWLTGIEISGKSNDLVIRGKALNSEQVPAYVRSLSREPVFAGRALSALQVTAREEQAPAKPAPGAPGKAASAAQPLRYLEFTLNIPLGRDAETASAATPRGAS